ncbi:MAG: crotonase/enoyl-CoA hydratase family protein [Novosphingobium sp.]
MSQLKTPSEERVVVSVDEQGIAQVRLVRSEKLNALDDAMFDAILAAGDRLAAMYDLRCVVLSGEGKGFCAGLDLAMLATLAGSDLQLAERSHGSANRFQQVAMQWRALPVPVIAAVHGVCFGGGLQIAAGADIRVVSADARLSVMELKWGIVPDMGHFALWRDLVREDVLRELTWTAREFSGDMAQALGFATHVDADPLARAKAMASEIAANDPAAIRAAKALFNGAADMTIEAILLAESVAQDRLLAARRS